MPPNNNYKSSIPNGIGEKDVEFLKLGKVPEPEYKITLVWRNIILFIILHILAINGLYRIFTSASVYTILFAYVLYFYGGLGITAGVHRLWSHKSYSVKLPLEIFLMIGNTLAFQNSIFDWVRDHRVHHKYSETNADPHNANRGFFFAHMGWLLCRKHPLITVKGQPIDLSDITSNPVVEFQRKHYHILMPLICFILPILAPVYFWNETWMNSITVSTMFRYTFTLHMTWFVNSAAHYFGGKPFDQHIRPAENVAVAIGALGEGWHNYHHTFPWDYKTSELGTYSLNFTTAFIDLMAKIGQAYDLRTVSGEMINRRAQRTGDGTHVSAKGADGKDANLHMYQVWGWGDEEMTEDDKMLTKVIN